MQLRYRELLNEELLVGFDHELDAAFAKQIEFSFDVGCVGVFARDSQFNLKGMRESRGVSQRQAARLLGMAQAKLSRMENGVILPSLDTLYKLIELYDIDPQQFSKEMQTAIENGCCVTPPIYTLAHKQFQPNDEQDWEQLWRMTAHQWRIQAGIPLDFRTARFALGIKEYAHNPTTIFSQREQKRLESDGTKAIDAYQIFYVAIAYRISPLSLVNGILLRTLDRSNMVLGGKVRVMTGHNQQSRPTYISTVNEAFFTQLKELIIKMGLIPRWQVEMWRSLILSVLAMYTRESHGINKFLPFPLTPRNYREWITDPILELYTPETPPKSSFWFELAQKLPHDDLKNKTESQFNYWVVNQPNKHKDWAKKVMEDEG
ncbi:helix-turn-helix transcriptional regulator [Vibrio parahaemolyticus]|nr:helix-turn-helix transcriptional regulator [Vibrio parahaemolyticus]